MLDAVVISDDAGRYVDANPAALQLFGRSRDEMLSLGIVDIAANRLPDDDAGEQFRRFLEHGTMSGEFTIQRKDGVTRVVEYRAVAHIAPGLHLSVMRDVTERKRAESALRRSEERFRGLFEALPLPMLAFDPQTLELRAVNRAAVQAYGYSREEFASMRADRLCQPEDLDDFLRRACSAEIGRHYTTRARHRRKSGELFDVEVFHHVARIDERPTVVALIHDADAGRLQES